MELKHYLMRDFERNYIDEIHNGDFKGIWREMNDGGIDIDEFEMYKIFGYNYIVTEKGQYRMVGKLEDCLNYIHGWL